jgi:capsular polysaccharide biosynthesis protein
MKRYLEVFFRHKGPLVGLIVICLAVSTVVVMILPRTYQASASLWFDQSPISDSSAANSQLTPADQATALIHEMVNTRDFDTKAGRRGPLATYYDSTGNFPNSDPVTPIVHWLEGKPAPTGTTRAALVDSGVVTTLQKYVVVAPTGPHVVSLSFGFSDPTIAAGTLKAVIDQFGEQVKSTILATAQGSVDFYDAQVAPQLKVVQAADAALARYVTSHPDVRAQNAPFDPTYAGLQQDDDLARQDYAALTQKLVQAKLTVASLEQPGPYGFRIIDLPQAPLSASGLLKSVLFGVGGGIGVGLLLVSVISLLLVATDDSVMRGSELQQRLGLQVIGEVPLLSLHLRRADAPRKALPPKLA